MTQSATDKTNVVQFLTDQHKQIRALFDEVDKATDKTAKDKAFVQLRRLLAVHETAEEQIVHPQARSAVPNGQRVVEARLQEENAAKQALTELEKLDVTSVEFATQFAQLRTAVLAHAENEETEEFPALEAQKDSAALAKMARAVAVAEKLAPTRPHAGVESAAGNTLAGPFAAMLDRARDAFSDRG